MMLNRKIKIRGEASIEWSKPEVLSPFSLNIESETIANSYYRKVLFTGMNMQLVLMSLKPKEEIGLEIHAHVDQFFRIEKGEAIFVFPKEQNKMRRFTDGDAIIVPAGTHHNIINNSEKEDLKLYTIYSPPNHPPKTIQKEKIE